MIPLQPTNSTTEEVQQIKLEKARLEWASTKTQMSVGAALIFLACLVGYWRTLGIGFLMSDFVYVSTVAQAAAGNFNGILQTIVGTPGDIPSDLLVPYQPLVSVSILFDYLLWHTNA